MKEIRVRPGQQIRGVVIDGERPSVILVEFTKQNILEVVHNEKKFMEWLSQMVYHALRY